MDKATFGAGCFWGVEHQFKKIPGVLETAVGYSGGKVEGPSYEQVCSGTTGHAEVVDLSFDPKRVSYEALVELFFSMHDPTTKDRQGPDVGSQYRSVIFYHSSLQQEIAEKAKLAWAGRLSASIVTEIEEAGPFYRAEEYHQCYFQKQGQP